MVLFEENFEPQIVTSNTLISLVKNKIFSEKNYENLFGMAQNFYSTQHMLFFFIFLLTVKIQILPTTPYICVHANMMKDWNFNIWWKFPIFYTPGYACFFYKHVAC